MHPDNLPVRDPAFLFDRPEYHDSGTLFWPDVIRMSRTNEAWIVGDIPYRDMPSLGPARWCWTRHAAGARCV